MSQAIAVTERSKGREVIRSAFWLTAITVALVLHIWFPRVETDPVNDTYNVDLGGRNAIYQFAQRQFPFTRRNHRSLIETDNLVSGNGTLCLLGPARYPTEREWDGLLNWVGQGGGLLLAARWEDAELTIPRLRAQVIPTVEKINPMLGASRRRTKGQGGSKSPSKSPTTDPSADPESIPDPKSPSDEPLPDNSPTGSSARSSRPMDKPSGSISGITGTTLLPEVSAVTWESQGKISAPDGDVLISAGDKPQAVQIHYGKGVVVLIASDYIFSNTALFADDKQNRLLAVKLLEAAGEREVLDVVFDESLNETGTPRVVGILLDPLLRPITLQILVVVLAFGWRGSRRFGGLLPEALPRRRDVADHTNALGNLYYRSRNGTVALKAYLDQLRGEFHLRLTHRADKGKLARLAQRVKMPLDELQDLLDEAGASADRPHLNRRAAASLIRRLARLRRAANEATRA